MSEEQLPERVGKIYEQLSAVQMEVGPVGKDSQNLQQKYNYRSIDAIYNVVGPCMAKNRVFVVPKVISENWSEKKTKKGDTMATCLVTMRFRFTTTDGSYVDAETKGQGDDFTDKAMSKAQTAAYKTCLQQMFCLPYEDIDPDSQTPKWKQEVMNKISFQDLNALKGAWLQKSKTVATTDEEKSKASKEFADWVLSVLDVDGDMRDSFDPLEFSQWSSARSKRACGRRDDRATAQVAALLRTLRFPGHALRGPALRRGQLRALQPLS